MISEDMAILLTPQQAKKELKQYGIRNVEPHGNYLRAVIRKDGKLIRIPLNAKRTMFGIFSAKDEVDELKALSTDKLITMKQLKAKRSSREFKIKEYITSYKTRKYVGIAAGTHKSYNTHFNRITTKFGDVDIAAISRLKVEEWAVELTEKLKNKTISETLRLLDHLFQDAVYDDYLQKNPINLKKLKEHFAFEVNHSTMNPFTTTELSKIRANTHSYPLITYATLFNSCAGLRLSELLALCWEDIDLENRVITVKRAWVLDEYKTIKCRGQSERRVEILDSAYKYLLKLKALTFDQASVEKITKVAADNRSLITEEVRFVLQDAKTGMGFKCDGAFRDCFYKMLDTAQIQRRGPNQCRHTFASRALSNGAPLEYISEQLGHSNTKLTQKYYAKWIKSDNSKQRDATSRAVAI